MIRVPQKPSLAAERIMFVLAVAMPVIGSALAAWFAYRENLALADMWKVAFTTFPSSIFFVVIGLLFRLFRLPKQRKFDEYKRALQADRVKGRRPLTDTHICVEARSMGRQQIDAYEFSDTAFVVGSDPVVCVVPLSMLNGFMTVSELDGAFSGHASYRQAPWMKRYVGVWGRKNCQRLRRLLRERGANVAIHRERPAGLGLASFKTIGTRKRVRALPARNGS